MSYRNGILVKIGQTVSDKIGCTYRIVNIGSEISGRVEVKSSNGAKVWEKVENLHLVY